MCNIEPKRGESYAYVGDTTDGKPTWCEVVDTMHDPDRRASQAKVQLDVKVGHEFGRPKKMRPIWVFTDELEPLSKHPLLT